MLLRSSVCHDPAQNAAAEAGDFDVSQVQGVSLGLLAVIQSPPSPSSFSFVVKVCPTAGAVVRWAASSFHRPLEGRLVRVLGATK